MALVKNIPIESKMVVKFRLETDNTFNQSELICYLRSIFSKTNSSGLRVS